MLVHNYFTFIGRHVIIKSIQPEGGLTIMGIVKKSIRPDIIMSVEKD